jgi:hypothetical protein
MTIFQPIYPYVVILSVLAFLFVLRVAGQLIVFIYPVGFLPPMEEWYSGLLPYPVLLPFQLLIILIMVKIIRDFTMREGFFVVPRVRAGSILQWFSYIYCFSMVVRYVVTMWLHPNRRWFQGTIPIWFHMVLAAFLSTLSHYYLYHQTSKKLPVE